jgi:heme/copper-type cytochrome/quinol oxidase subunit 2
MSALATTDRPTAVGAPRHAVALVAAMALSLAAWTTHVVALSSLVPLRRRHPGAEWVMHAVTVVTALVCVGAIALGVRYRRRATGAEADGTPDGRTHFLATMTILVAAANLLLILFESVYALAMVPHG